MDKPLHVFGRMVTARPVIALLVLAAITAGLAAATVRLERRTAFESFASGEAGRALERVETDFGAGAARVRVLIDAGPGADVLSSSGFDVHRRLSDALSERVPEVLGGDGQAVTSFVSVVRSALAEGAPGDGSPVRSGPPTDAAIDAAVQQVTARPGPNPLAGLVSEDRLVAGRSGDRHPGRPGGVGSMARPLRTDLGRGRPEVGGRIGRGIPGYGGNVTDLRRAAVVMAAIVALTACGGDSSPHAPPTAARAEQAVDAEGVTVIGEGRVSATPDTARIAVGVEVRRPAAQEAFEEANAAAAAVLDALRDRGVDDDDLRTRDISLREERKRTRGGEPQPVGYVATNSVEVTVRDLDRTGDLIGAAVGAGGDAARVDRLEFIVDDDRAALEQARQRAFADAERRAQQYAQLAGRDLGALASLTESGGADGPRPVPEAADAAAPPVAPGQQEIVVRVQARWELD